VGKVLKLTLKLAAKFLRDGSLFFLAAITILSTTSGGVRNSEPDRDRSLRTDDELEIRCEFYPTRPYPDESVVPTFIVIAQDGHARALRYQLHDQTKNIASYEGVLPSDDVRRLFARVRTAFRLPKYRKDYDRKLVYETDGFYLALKHRKAKATEMSGGLETKPDDVRALVRELSEVWKRLKEAPPAFAYLTAHPVEKGRLMRLKREAPAQLTRIESLPEVLKSFLIPVVTQPLDFYALTQAQYEEINRHKLLMIYKGIGHELTVFSSSR
jgi:hypothetical protein